MKNLNTLFDLLTDWRQLPAYQLERRADIFFALYLEDLLTYCGYFAAGDQLTVIPEFPAKQEHMNLSDRIDYMVASDDKMVYVELKTDNHSIRAEQALYLHKIQKKKLSEVFFGHYLYLRNDYGPRQIQASDRETRPVDRIHGRTACQGALSAERGSHREDSLGRDCLPPSHAATYPERTV